MVKEVGDGCALKEPLGPGIPCAAARLPLGTPAASASAFLHCPAEACSSDSTRREKEVSVEAGERGGVGRDREGEHSGGKWPVNSKLEWRESGSCLTVTRPSAADALPPVSDPSRPLRRDSWPLRRDSWPSASCPSTPVSPEPASVSASPAEMRRTAPGAAQALTATCSPLLIGSLSSRASQLRRRAPAPPPSWLWGWSCRSLCCWRSRMAARLARSHGRNSRSAGKRLSGPVSRDTVCQRGS